MKRSTIHSGLGRFGVRALLARIRPWSGVLVLTYHRIGDGSATVFDRGLWSATADAFAAQIRFCKTHFDVIAPGQLPDALTRRRGRFLLITFDDGYRDNYEVAFPILKAEGTPATFFVTTGFMDAPRVPWWDEIAWMVRTSTRAGVNLPGWLATPVRFDDPDREGAIRTVLRTYKSIPTAVTGAFLTDVADATGSGRPSPEAARRWWMTWDMLRAMQAGGMTIGGHTVDHPILARASRGVQHDEIGRCGARLALELGERMRCFSYPVGGSTAFDADTRAALQEAGVQFAFSNYSGYRRFDDWDDYDIRRVPIESYLTREWFRSVVALPQLFA
jgi:peptidoglycan/xylan/chitin deacetylase (PgdA/CDA1 family)